MVGVKEILGGVAEAAMTAVAILGLYAAALWEAAKMAIALSQEKAALAAVFDIFTGGMGGKLLGELEDLSKELPFTADKLNVWAKGLLAAGIQGEALRTGIRAIAAATAIMGEEGGRAAEGLIKRLEMTAAAGGKVAIDRRFLTQLGQAGVSVQALAKQLGVAPEKLSTMTVTAKQLGDAMQKALIAQGEGPLQKLGNTWDSISAKVKEGFEDAFEDLSDLVDPFMAEVKSFASEFFAGGIAAKDFGGVVRSSLSVAFEVAKNFVNFLHRGFLHVQIAILQARIALKPFTSALGEIDGKAVAVNVALYVLKGTVIVLAVVFGLLAIAVALVALPFVVVGLAIYGVVRAVQYLAGVITGAIANFDNLKNAASRAGTDLILGLGNAILAGHAWVVGLITNLATSMIGAVKTTLGIKSPSKVMMQIGGYTTAGLVAGIDAGAPEVQASAAGAGMAAVRGASQGATQGGGAGSSSDGRKVEINVHEGAVKIAGNADARVLQEALAQILEQIAIQAGLGVPQGA
jgi:hypothetical protein